MALLHYVFRLDRLVRKLMLIKIYFKEEQKRSSMHKTLKKCAQICHTVYKKVIENSNGQDVKMTVVAKKK